MRRSLHSILATLAIFCGSMASRLVQGRVESTVRLQARPAGSGSGSHQIDELYVHMRSRHCCPAACTMYVSLRILWVVRCHAESSFRSARTRASVGSVVLRRPFAAAWRLVSVRAGGLLHIAALRVRACVRRWRRRGPAHRAVHNICEGTSPFSATCLARC